MQNEVKIEIDYYFRRFMTYEYALTAIRDANLDWQEHPNGGFIAEMNGVTIYAGSSSITFSKNLKKNIVQKPAHPIWKKETTLIEQLFEEIIKQAAKQCLEHYTDEYQEKLKNDLLRELTGFNK